MAVDTANAQTACDRACLTRFVDTYFNALVAKNPSAVPLAASAKITTNGRVMKLDQAFWDSAERAVYRWDIQEIHAVLFNLPDAQLTGWEPQYGPGSGGR